MAISTNIYKSWQHIQKQKFTEMKRHLASLSEDIFHKKLVLDIGCGFGYFEKEVRSNFVGLDKDLMMLRGRVKIFPAVLGDGNNLPFKDASFDSIISTDTMHFIENKDFVRVLKPNGFALFSIFFNDENYAERKEALLKKVEPLEVVSELDILSQEKEYVVVARK